MIIFSLSGVVQEGEKKGTALGFPTANILSESLAYSGTYAGVVTLRGENYPAAIYADPERELLEAHILDFDEDVYSENITIDLLEKVSDSLPFTDEKSLQDHITQSVRLVRAYFEK